MKDDKKPKRPATEGADDDVTKDLSDGEPSITTPSKPGSAKPNSSGKPDEAGRAGANP